MKEGTIAALLAVVLAWTGGIATATATGSQVADQQSALDVPGGEVDLGSVRIPRQVMADGKLLPAGTYRVRLTANEASPDVPGQLQRLNRWAEFVQQGEVKGREVVSIIPQDEIREVAESALPRTGGSRVEMLKGNDYLRVWINRGGVHYLIHLPPA